MSTWQKLMSYKQSQKNEDKMMKKCKKKKIKKWKLLCRALIVAGQLDSGAQAPAPQTPADALAAGFCLVVFVS